MKNMKPSKDKIKASAGGVAGAAAGTSIGLAGSMAAISTAGTAGLSGAGITSGLCAIGGSILGGAALLSCGVAVLAVGCSYGGYKLATKLKKS
jgi:hypothetical protein